MTPEPVEPKPWAPGRWWFAIGLVFLLQVVLILLFTGRSPGTPKRGEPASRLGLSPRQADAFLALDDPTLLILPQPHGFSGEAWLRIPPVPFEPTNWWEPPCYLQLPANELGGSFHRFMQTNLFSTMEAAPMVPPEMTAPPAIPDQPLLVRSTLKLAGGLSSRRLVSSLDLPLWTNIDLLTNSVVQVVVDARGDVFSAVPLRPGSGSTNVDACAQELAKSARFEPLTPANAAGRSGIPELTFGAMIFEWKTVLEPRTNPPPENF